MKGPKKKPRKPKKGKVTKTGDEEHSPMGKDDAQPQESVETPTVWNEVEIGQPRTSKLHVYILYSFGSIQVSLAGTPNQLQYERSEFADLAQKCELELAPLKENVQLSPPPQEDNANEKLGGTEEEQPEAMDVVPGKNLQSIF